MQDAPVEPSWAPDGTQIVFSRQDGGGTTIQVFVVNSDGTGLQQLTSGPEWNRADDVTHVGMYLGHGDMVDAPHTGAVVRIESYRWSDYVGATRPAG